MEELYAQETIESMPQILERKKWELPIEFFPAIKERCMERNIMLGCTPFYLDAVDELEEYVDFYKVASYELLWHDLIRKCAQKNQPLILSTGMANMEEILNANEVIKKINKKNYSFTLCIKLSCKN